MRESRSVVLIFRAASAAGSGGSGTPAVVYRRDGDDNVIVEYGDQGADYTNVAVRKVSPDGIISTVTGDGLGLSWGGQAAVDGAGNLFIADPANQVIRKVSGGIISTVAGTHGVAGTSGDGGPPLQAPHVVFGGAIVAARAGSWDRPRPGSAGRKSRKPACR